MDVITGSGSQNFIFGTMIVAPRIAVVGAGIGGLALGAILTRKLPKAKVTILERSHTNRDEGYGLDLDEHGQEALVRAGVDHRFWEVSRLRSDTWNTFPLKGSEPLFTKFTRTREAESNRAGIRDIFIDAIQERGSSIEFEHHVADVRPTDNKAVEIVAHDGSVIGEYDLVFDACGLHSPLRTHRVTDPIGKHFTGRTLIHGVINSPEESTCPQLVKRLGEGTVLAVGRGYFIILQRFGADFEDKRTAFFYHAGLQEKDGAIQEEMGITESTSRESGILRRGDDDFVKAQEWLHDDMGNFFDPLWHTAIDGLDRVTVRGDYSHGSETKLRTDSESTTLPFVCCGDSLRNIGLGGGGNLAIQDALGYSKVLSKGEPFDPETGRLTTNALEALREEEAEALKRKQEHYKRQVNSQGMMHVRDPKVDPNCTRLGDFADKWHWRFLLNAGGNLLHAATKFAEWKGWTEGSDETTVLHPQVLQAMKEEGIPLPDAK